MPGTSSAWHWPEALHAGSQRLAVRDSSAGLTTLYGDHLGSASVAVTASGAVQRMRYKPWGEARGTSAGAFATDRLFTGQLYDGDTTSGGTGLYFYNARYYDPALGRFTQADPLVPGSMPLTAAPSDPMAAEQFFAENKSENLLPISTLTLDRYSYVNNNPLRYDDPSGNCIPELCPRPMPMQEDYATYYDYLVAIIAWTYTQEYLYGDYVLGRNTISELRGSFIGEFNTIVGFGYSQEATDYLLEAMAAGGATTAASIAAGRGIGGSGLARGLPNGLRGSSRGLQNLYGGGSVRGTSIIDIRSTLLNDGFTQTKTRNGKGYLFTNSSGEQVRIMRRGGKWDIRVRNRYGNYLDEYGYVAGPNYTHNIEVIVR